MCVYPSVTKIVYKLKLEMGFRIRLLKLVIVVPNTLTLIIGITMIVFGSIAANKANDFDYSNGRYDFAHDKIRDGSAVAIVAGILTSIVSVLALCAASAKSRPLLIIYCVIMSFVLILEIAAAVLGFKFYGHIKDKFEGFLMRDLDSWNNTADGGNSKGNYLIYVQSHLECCGVEGPNDWLNAKNWNPDGTTMEFLDNPKQLPVSCCGNKVNQKKCVLQTFYQTKQLPLTSETDKHIVRRLTNGCYDQLLKGAYLLGTVSIAIFFFQLTVLFFAIYFIRKIKEDSTVSIF